MGVAKQSNTFAVRFAHFVTGEHAATACTLFSSLKRDALAFVFAYQRLAIRRVLLRFHIAAWLIAG